MQVKEQFRYLANFIARLFTILTLFMTASTLGGNMHATSMGEIGLFMLDQRHIAKIFIFVALLGMITLLKTNLETHKKMMRLTFLQRNCLFVPLYYLVAAGFIYDYFWLYGFGTSRQLLHGNLIAVATTVTGIFLLVFIIRMIIVQKQFRRSRAAYGDMIEYYRENIIKTEEKSCF